MKKLINVILLIACTPNFALADCDFSAGITKLDDGSYKYSKECHVKVGEMKRDLDIAGKQVVELNKALELKDLALTKSNERIALWMDTTYKLEDRLNKIDDLYKRNEWLYFGLGVATTLGAAYAASKFVQR